MCTCAVLSVKVCCVWATLVGCNIPVCCCCTPCVRVAAVDGFGPPDGPAVVPVFPVVVEGVIVVPPLVEVVLEVEEEVEVAVEGALPPCVFVVLVVVPAATVEVGVEGVRERVVLVLVVVVLLVVVFFLDLLVAMSVIQG